jgi:hypothetical protein
VGRGDVAQPSHSRYEKPGTFYEVVARLRAQPLDGILLVCHDCRVVGSVPDDDQTVASRGVHITRFVVTHDCPRCGRPMRDVDEPYEVTSALGSSLVTYAISPGEQVQALALSDVIAKTSSPAQAIAVLDQAGGPLATVGAWIKDNEHLPGWRGAAVGALARLGGVTAFNIPDLHQVLHELAHAQHPGPDDDGQPDKRGGQRPARGRHQREGHAGSSSSGGGFRR